MPYQIAIDGPAASGKSTVARLLAKKLSFHYLDTGAMYRAICWYLLKEGVDVKDEGAVERTLASLSLSMEGDQIVIEGFRPREELRTDQVNQEVSLVSSYAAVRSYLVSRQQEIASRQDSILDGRDIGTVVLPQADLKIFLTASPEVRAKRRLADQASASTLDYQALLEDIQRRDYLDSHRALSPLRPAEDSLILDTSDLSIEEVVDWIYRAWEGRR